MAHVRERGAATNALVADALRTVPRHIFLPDLPPDAAYRDEAIVTKRDQLGIPTSSSSQPTIMAIMLDQLGAVRGHKVLEVGTGTGFNAALLAHIVGPKGRVVSIDLDQDVVDRAEENLSAAGVERVTVLTADGALGHPDRAPYDRIIATVGVWDLAPAWLDQLAPDGRIVVPLDLRGVQRSVAFEREGDHWASRSAQPCGFMRMRGALKGPEGVYVLDADTQLTLSLPDVEALAGDLDAEAVVEALDDPETEIRTGVSPERIELLDGFGLWLAIREPRWFALAEAGSGTRLRHAPLQAPDGRATVGMLDDFGLATMRLDEGGELAVAGAEQPARELAGQITAWNEAGRPGSEGLHIDAYPPGTPVDGEYVIDKRCVRLVLSWA
ncbi:methyltransferase, FxLD system [Actinophytocola xanthii]|uniref:Protein-L-isoaspartate O-methyltransferase n=1 Tax=Actinophytocola xanthii TaxID=1912961 RepID=A0A1Q8CR49_9PSEU|nr:methyltransferase, FxLD system [Actinophytocola xanthii]